MELALRRNLISVVLCIGLIAPALLTATPSSAANPPLECKKISARTAPGDSTKQTFRYCGGPQAGETGGDVLSKDGTSLLDVSVTMPAKGNGPFPLMVILHGLTQSKKTFESDPSIKTDAEPDGQTVEGTGGRYHYNNLWFASKGYMVLTYTTRGWNIFRGSNPNDVISESECEKFDSAGSDNESVDGKPDDMYPGFEPRCYVQLAHLNYEIADTQYLIGRLVDGTLTDADGVKAHPRKVGITGPSYGGGQTWTLTRRNQWKSPKGTPIRIDGAAPIIGWTDLGEALLPNGQRSDTDASQSLEDRMEERLGVKNDYVDVFYTAASNLGTGGLGQIVDYLKRWKNRLDDGEPYEGDPMLEDAVEKILTKRSAFYISKKSEFDTPIFTVQAFTDGLFTAIQSIRMYNRLQAERAAAGEKKYPISMYLGDWGHSPSQAKQDEMAYIANAVTAWMNYYVKNKGNKPASDVEARTTVCDGSRGELGALYRGAEWTDLNSGAPYTFTHEPAGLPADLVTPADDPHDDRLVPSDGGRGDINGVPDGSCRTTDRAVDEDNWHDEEEVSEANGPVRMLGLPEVSFTALPEFDEMYVAARLWDVDPGADSESVDDDTQTLVTRGVYRLGAGDQPEDVSFKLFGNGYTFPVGHSIKLELTADDSPSWQQWRQNDAPGTGTIQIDDVDLTIPTANCEKRLPECDL
jgi:predicted acyl esterase